MPAAFVEFPAELFGFGSLFRGGRFAGLSALQRMVELLLAVGERRLAASRDRAGGPGAVARGPRSPRESPRLVRLRRGIARLRYAAPLVVGKRLLGGRQLVAARAQLVLLGAELLPLLLELLRGLPQFDGCTLGLLRLDDQRRSLLVEPRLQGPQLPFPVGDLLGTIREFFRVCLEQLALARQPLALFFERRLSGVRGRRRRSRFGPPFDRATHALCRGLPFRPAAARSRRAAFRVRPRRGPAPLRSTLCDAGGPPRPSRSGPPFARAIRVRSRAGPFRSATARFPPESSSALRRDGPVRLRAGTGSVRDLFAVARAARLPRPPPLPPGRR